MNDSSYLTYTFDINLLSLRISYSKTNIFIINIYK